MSAAAIRVSGKVTGSRLTIRRPTGTSYWSETPRSPRTARVSHSVYWTEDGPVQSERLAQARRRLGAALGADDHERGIAGQDADDDEHEGRDEEEGRDERRDPPGDVPPHALGGCPGYLTHATSERSLTPAPAGRSFQRPWRPFLVTTSRGWMYSHTTGASSTSFFWIFT